MRHVQRNGKLKAALGLLNEAVHEKKDRVFEMMEDQYAALKDQISEQAVHGKEMASRAKSKLVKSLREEEEAILKKAKAMDRQIHTNPWPYMGAAALGAFVIGVRMGRRGKKKKEPQSETAEQEAETSK